MYSVSRCYLNAQLLSFLSFVGHSGWSWRAHLFFHSAMNKSSQYLPQQEDTFFCKGTRGFTWFDSPMCVYF